MFACPSRCPRRREAWYFRIFGDPCGTKPVLGCPSGLLALGAPKRFPFGLGGGPEGQQGTLAAFLPFPTVGVAQGGA